MALVADLEVGRDVLGARQHVHVDEVGDGHGAAAASRAPRVHHLQHVAAIGRFSSASRVRYSTPTRSTLRCSLSLSLSHTHTHTHFTVSLSLSLSHFPLSLTLCVSFSTSLRLSFSSVSPPLLLCNSPLPLFSFSHSVCLSFLPSSLSLAIFSLLSSVSLCLSPSLSFLLCLSPFSLTLSLSPVAADVSVLPGDAASGRHASVARRLHDDHLAHAARRVQTLPVTHVVHAPCGEKTSGFRPATH